MCHHHLFDNAPFTLFHKCIRVKPTQTKPSLSVHCTQEMIPCLLLSSRRHMKVKLAPLRQHLKTHRSGSHLWLAPHFLTRPSCHVPHPHFPHLPPPLLTPRHLPTSFISRWASLLSQSSLHSAPRPTPDPPPCPARLHLSCLLRCSGGCAGPVGPPSQDRANPRYVFSRTGFV